VIVAAHHERDLHRDVIRDDSEIVDRRRIRSEDYEILEVLVRESDALVNEIIPFGGTLGNSKTNDERITRVDSSSDLLGGESIASPVVLNDSLRASAARRRSSSSSAVQKQRYAAPVSSILCASC
jgi:hypothetical protein